VDFDIYFLSVAQARAPISLFAYWGGGGLVVEGRNEFGLTPFN
jgi:hypothetical protein